MQLLREAPSLEYEKWLELHAGDLGFVPQGWAGIWEVVEPVRKAYVVTT